MSRITSLADLSDQGDRSSHLLVGVTATGAGISYEMPPLTPDRTLDGTVSGTGAVSATIVVEVCNDNTNWKTLGTITLTGTTSASDGFVSSASWRYVRGNVTAISGTGATINLTLGF